MGLETVKEEVLSRAKEQANSLISASKKEAAALAKDTEKKIGLLKEKSESEAKKAIEVLKRQAVASAELEAKKMVLEVKKEVINSVFADSRKRLDGMDEKRKEATLRKLLDRAKKEVEIGHVYCSKKDVKLLKDLNPLTIDITGGIIAENKDKTIRVDYSFDTLLDSIKESELQNINKILFG